MTTKLAAALKAARSLKGMTQSDVAKALNVTRSAVGQWEASTSEPSTSNLIKLQGLLGVDFSAAYQEEWRELKGHPPVKVDKLEELEAKTSYMETASPFYDLPVEGIVLSDEGLVFDWNFIGQKKYYVFRFLFATMHPNTYGLHIASLLMYPRFDVNDIIFVNPDQQPGTGEYCIIHLNRYRSSLQPARILRRLVIRTSAALIVDQIRPELQEEIPIELVQAIHRVVPWNVLLQIATSKVEGKG